MKRIAQLVLGFAVVAACWAAAGAAQVGDEIRIQFRTVTGQTISSDQLKGKLVVLDFWATWCGPCMQMVPHMVELNQKYATRGLQIIGISLDDDRAKMLEVIKQNAMSWPEYFDGMGWENKLWKQFGSNGIPYTILLSPEGRVLYAGHPAGGLDQAIERAFKEHPPQLVEPAVLAKANELFDAAQKKLDGGDTRAAIRELGKVPVAARLDEKFAARAAELQKKLEESANSLLDEVKKQIEQKKYIEAVGRLKDLTGALEGLPVATKAKKMLSDLMSDADARAAIATADKKVKADEALEVARKLQRQKKHELAYERFKEIVKAFAGTDAATAAQEQVQHYESDPQFVKQVTQKASAAKAKAALSLAESYKHAGRTDLARKKLQSVIDEFPNTPYAAEAATALRELGDQ